MVHMSNATVGINKMALFQSLNADTISDYPIFSLVGANCMGYA